MERKAIKKPDGTIWIAHGNLGVLPEGDIVLDASELPDAKYRECWREKNGQIVVDLDLARAKKLAELRAIRDEKLAETDKEWMKLASQGQDLTAINAKKQALRDLPEQMESDLAAKRKAETIDAYEPEWP